MAHVTLNNGFGSFHFGSGVVSPVMTTPPRVSGQDALKHVLDNMLCLSNLSCTLPVTVTPARRSNQ